MAALRCVNSEHLATRGIQRDEADGFARVLLSIAANFERENATALVQEDSEYVSIALPLSYSDGLAKRDPRGNQSGWTRR